MTTKLQIQTPIFPVLGIHTQAHYAPLHAYKVYLYRNKCNSQMWIKSWCSIVNMESTKKTILVCHCCGFQCPKPRTLSLEAIIIKQKNDIRIHRERKNKTISPDTGVACQWKIEHTELSTTSLTSNFSVSSLEGEFNPSSAMLCTAADAEADVDLQQWCLHDINITIITGAIPVHAHENNQVTHIHDADLTGPRTKSQRIYS